MRKYLCNLIAINVLTLFVFGTVSAQTYKYCGSTQMQNEVYKNHPELKVFQDSLDEFQNEIVNNHLNFPQPENMPPVYVIPIVFHVLHQWGAENISDAQILDELRILNEDYRRLNSDTSTVIAQFKQLIGDAEIEFRIATKDPSGNCTNGIDRIVSPETNNGNDGSKLNPWPRNKYLNVWTCKNMAQGVAGYAYKPGGVPTASVDGIMILADYIGSIGTGAPGTSRALTHEIGHFLNLDHPWGGTNNPGVACGDDGVTDTPVTMGWSFCPSISNADVCNVGTVENYQNYMDYSYCSHMFTLMQCTKMRLALTSAVAQRNALWQTSNLNATGTATLPGQVCAPVPYINGGVNMICEGASVNFSGAAVIGTATSYSWTFQGGSPGTDNNQNTSITYYTAGTYDVTLTVSNSSGSNSVTLPGYVVVSPSSGTYHVPITEGFENITFPGSDWFLNDLGPGTNTWQRVNTAHHDVGSWCLKKNNHSGSYEGTDEVISPSLNFKWTSGVSLSFWRAFALKSGSAADQLRVLSSTNCGGLWTQRFIKTGAALQTGGIVNNAFTPNTSSDWAQETVSMATSAVSGKDNVRLKFEYLYDNGDNLYLDDINITGTVGIDNAVAQSLDFDVYPNPSKAKATKVHFTLDKDENMSINIYDVTGRKVEEMVNQHLEAGVYEYELQNNLDKGVYFVKLEMDGGQLAKKIVVE